MPLQNNRVLITGTSGGLGKYLSDQFSGCLSLNRKNKEEVFSECSQIELVVHCAFNSRRDADKYQLLKDNVFLTDQLCRLNYSHSPAKKFVYISSIDVYRHDKTDYNIMKEYSESIVKDLCDDYLILRCPALLGRDMRKNNFLKIIEDKEPKLSLSEKSSFNFIAYRDIINVIKYAYANDITGTFDVVSDGNVNLEQVANIMSKECSFGSFDYVTPEIDRNNIVSTFKFMNKTSLEVVKNFIKEKND